MADEIKGVDLTALVSEVSDNIVEEKKKSAKGMIRELFYKYEGIEKEIRDLTKQLEAKKTQRDKINDRVERLRNGDWSILSEPPKEKPE